MQVWRLANTMFDIGAIISHGTIDICAAAHQVTELAAETVPDRTDLAVTFRELLQVSARVLHIANRKVVVEVVVEIEGLLDVIRIFVGELDARLLPPEEIRHETNKAGLGELMGMMTHRVIDAPYFHDRNDCTGRRFIGDGNIGAHLAVAQLHLDVSRLHECLY